MTIDDFLSYAPLMSALIGCVAGIFAAASATFAGVQIRLARKMAVVQTLQVFCETAAEHEAVLASAENNAGKLHALHEFMNFIELYAAICNHQLIKGRSRAIVRDRLIDSVVVIECVDEWNQTLDQTVFHERTFSELKKFLKRNNRRLKKHRWAAQQRTTPAS